MFKKEELDLILDLLYSSIERLDKELDLDNTYLNGIEKAEKFDKINQYKNIVIKIESLNRKVESMIGTKVEAFSN